MPLTAAIRKYPLPTLQDHVRFADLVAELARADESGEIKAQVVRHPTFGCPVLMLVVPETEWIEVEIYDPAGSIDISGNPEWAAIAIDNQDGGVDTDGLVWGVGQGLPEIADRLVRYVEDLQNGRVVLS